MGKDSHYSTELKCPDGEALPGPDYFDEEANYSRLFEFCQVTFCHSRQWPGSRDFWQNNLVAAVKVINALASTY
jgi:hypothetical protein